MSGLTYQTRIHRRVEPSVWTLNTFPQKKDGVDKRQEAVRQMGFHDEHQAADSTVHSLYYHYTQFGKHC